MNFRKVLIIVFLTVIFSQTVLCQSRNYKWKFEQKAFWRDEFNGESIDLNKWSFETGGDGWGNNELQYYTDGRNIEIKKGVLKIIAHEENMHSLKYTSSRLITKDKCEWKYGRIKFRAKMSKGRGTWPAVWMLPVKGFNASGSVNGEIDILEYVGFEPGLVHFSIHTKNNNSDINNEITSSKYIKTADSKFHIYRMDWTPYGIMGFIDGKKYFEYLNTGDGHSYWPFDEKFFLIMNLAIGGDWRGIEGVDNKIFPAVMEIDYVRVYKFIE